MDFFVLILGTDANAYYMARCCYEEYKIKPHLIGQRRLAFTKFSNILTVEYCSDFWKEETFLEVINNYAKNSEYKKMEKLANEFLKMENPDNEILKKLVKRVVFDKNKKITVELTFSQVIIN